MLENFLSEEEYINWFSRNHSNNTLPFLTSNTSYTEKVKSKDNIFCISKNTSASLPCLAGWSKSKEVISDTFLARKSDNQGQWMIKNAEVATTNFESLWIVTKLFAFDDLRMIRKSLEDYFQAKIVINHLFGENARISIDQGSIKDRICEEGKWHAMGSFHLKFEKWNKLKHFISNLKSGTNLNISSQL